MRGSLTFKPRNMQSPHKFFRGFSLLDRVRLVAHNHACCVVGFRHNVFLKKGSMKFVSVCLLPALFISIGTSASAMPMTTVINASPGSALQGSLSLLNPTSMSLNAGAGVQTASGGSQTSLSSPISGTINEAVISAIIGSNPPNRVALQRSHRCGSRLGSLAQKLF